MSVQEYYEIGEHFSNKYQAEIGQMFGKPCLKMNKKAFAFFYKGDMVFKLNIEEVNLLKTKYLGAKNWDPSGRERPMKNWIQVPDDYNNDWMKLAKKAFDFVNG